MKTKLPMHIPEALDDCNVEITGAVILPDEDYQKLFATGQLPEAQLGRLNKYTEAVTPIGSTMISRYKVLLVLSENDMDGVAVCGHRFVSYAAVFPFAKELLTNRINQMADFVCSLKDVPNYDTHLIPLEMVSDFANIKVTADNGIGELLMQEIQKRGNIADIQMTDGSLDIKYAERQSEQKSLNLRSLLNVHHIRLEDVHLCDVDEEHDLATVVELDQNTLTELGRHEWADVLDAKVERIYAGYYGTQIELSGCDPDRLRDFSFMLAGQYSYKDYDQWVRQEQGEPMFGDHHADLVQGL